MASAPSEPRPVLGRVDRAGRLVSADPELEALQREAGSALGQPLALPQVAAVAQLARKLRTAVSRPALAASTDHDIELWVQATPQGDEIALSLEGWTVRAPAGPRLAAILGAATESETGGARNEWSADEELRIISLSPDLADLLGADPDQVAGQPLTRVVRLEEDEAGEMPLISALAARRGFSGQRARSRVNEAQSVLLNGEVVTSADGSFAGFRGTVQANGAAPSAAEPARPAPFDLALDEVLANVITHGFEDSAEHEIIVRLDLESDSVRVAVEDEGVAFNPLNSPEPDLTLPLELRPIGGLGIHLVRNIMDELDYQRREGRNCLFMKKHVRPGGD